MWNFFTLMGWVSLNTTTTTETAETTEQDAEAARLEKARAEWAAEINASLEN